MKRPTWQIIGVLTALSLGIDVLAAWGWSSFIAREWQYLYAFVIGASVAQINLIAIWAALAPGRVMLRLPWSIFLATLMWYAIVIGLRTTSWWDNYSFSVSYYRSTPSFGDLVLLGIIVLIGVVVVQVPLWAMSRLSGWRLLPPATDVAQASADEAQFNLKHLIAGTLLASVMLGLGRVVLPAAQWETFDMEGELAVVIPAVLLVNLVVVVPCIWIAFARLYVLVPLAVAWVVWAIIASLIQIAILGALFGGPPAYVWVTFTLFNIAQGLAVIGALAVLRISGFRLLRTHHHEKIAASAMTAKAPLDIMQPEPSNVTPAIPTTEHSP